MCAVARHLDIAMADLQTSHTADLDPGTLHAARALLDAGFADLADSDWEHSLGGIHALVWDGAELIGHASVVQRRLLHGGRAWRTGYVEGVVVRDDHRGHGHGAALMAELERVIRSAYDLGALSATQEAVGFYAALGWTRWHGPTSALTPSGIRRTEDDDGAVYVLPVSVPVDHSAEITCDWRDGDLW
jgi:aminoglycoside 2'-N-acetyltransferase I